MKWARAQTTLTVLVLAAAPAVAQDDPQGLTFRPFVMAAQQQFAAKDTFDAAFGKHSETLFGGGINILQDGRFYLEVSAWQMKKTGQRAFISDGEAFPLGIPLRVRITPIEVSAGYRFRTSPWLRPYLGAGVGSYRYEESSDFAASDDEAIDTRHAGGILEGGVEVRLHRWIGVAADVHYTYVPGILGDAGLSKEADEKSLGGVAARFKVIVGR